MLSFVPREEYGRPPVFDGSRKGIIGCVIGLAHISKQLDYISRQLDKDRPAA